MKISLRIRLLTLFSLFLFVSISFVDAQVTIGAGVAPIDGVLLDLKEYNNENGGATTGRGLMLPRLILTGPTSLAAIQNVNASKPLQYTGLTVYNISGTNVPIGLNMWDGAKWVNFLTQLQANWPKSFVRVRGASSISVANVTLLTGWRRLALTVEDFDENSEYDNVTAFEFKAKQKGIYSVNAQVKVSALVQIGDVGVGVFIKRTGDTAYTLLAEQTVTVLSILNLNAFTRSVNFSKIRSQRGYCFWCQDARRYNITRRPKFLFYNTSSEIRITIFILKRLLTIFNISQYYIA